MQHNLSLFGTGGWFDGRGMSDGKGTATGQKDKNAM